MSHLRFDLRDVLRSLRRDAGYTLTAVLTLALTIGATTAMFSIVNGVLLRPLQYRESHQLVTIRELQIELADRFPVLPVNGHHFEMWRSQSQTFDSLAEYLPRAANLTGAGDPIQIALVGTTGTLFDVLQVQPIVGRALRVSDEPKGAPDVAVIGHALWRERFGGDPSIVGRTVTLDGKPHTIVGVLPPGFQIPEAPTLMGPVLLTAKVDALVPLRLPDDLGWAGDYNHVGLGRLKRGVSVEQGRADLDVVQSRVAQRVSDETHGPATLRVRLTLLSDAVIGGARRGLLLLMGAIGAVLPIACSNLANLSLTRATGRVRDAMIRTALGASRGRLVRQVLLEQLIVAGAGGSLGIGVAWGALRVFVRTAPIDLPRVSEVVIDARVLLFAAMVSIGAGLLTALLPAWRMISRDVQGSLRPNSLATTSERGGLNTRAVLLALQVALSVTLLVVTALFGVSFVKLMRVDRGFTADHVLAVDVSLPSSRYERAPVRVAAYDRILAALQALPGVASASWTSVLPLTGLDWGDLVTVEGDVRPIFERPIANYRFIAPDYFRTIEMPIRRGRSFVDADRAPSASVMPAVISEATAARAWPGQDALGKRFRRGNSEAKPFEVVGIVGDGRAAGIDTAQPMMVYVPYWFRSRPSAALVIRMKADPLSPAGDVRRSIQSVDPEIAVGESRPLEQIVDAAFAGRRYQVTLLVAFGAAALLIAVIGVYAVTAYGVARRRREMNIRVALGARASQVLRLVVRQTSVPVAVGAVAGMVGALAIGGVMASQLTDVGARNPRVLAGVAALVAAVSIATCTLAARQGLTINPASALRDE
jgi:putative ABC transport system permease protein